ncbi:bacterioferritin-associated ferredoxin [Mycolicibacterium iranicum]|uniref:Bacterioferritin-associated ferredoxin n=1 Tax=Mycolicibacterium iranicum TaxID=912594 RepID=A0ABT4HEJ8_MYCIR|nr:(2Fe-2S)-binding protein [Mycolicibacterium iranicum]MCZ0728276.1 (2Fe-2S)-binding protein [Mycolicibacterium iranicum]
MYVCLCLGVTNETVSEAVAAGATSTQQVAQACGAGSECGRCRRTVRLIIEAGTYIPTEGRPGKGSRV